MKPILVPAMLGLLAIAGMAPDAAAGPLEARVGVAGLPPFVGLAETDFKLPFAPLRFGGSAYYVLESNAQATIWGQYEHQLTPTVTIGGLAGVNYDWLRGATAAVVGAVEDKSLHPGRMGYLLGVSYRQDWERMWLRMTPSITLIPQDPLPPRPDQPEQGYQYRSPEVNLWRSLLMGGPPWLEVGYKVTPNVSVSLQANWLSFLKLSYSF